MTRTSTPTIGKEITPVTEFDLTQNACLYKGDYAYLKGEGSFQKKCLISSAQDDGSIYDLDYVVFKKFLEIYLIESKKHYKITSDWLYPENVTSPDLTRVRAFVKNFTNVKPHSEIQKRIHLNTLYQDEKSKYIQYFKNLREENIDRFYSTLFDKIVNLTYSEVAVEITRDSSIFLELRIQQYVLHLKITIGESSENTFFALYKNGTCIKSQVGHHDSIINQLLELNARISKDASAQGKF